MGMRLVVPPGFRRARSYASGRYEPEVTSLLVDIIKPGMGIVDVGAFCGYYTLLASHLVGSKGRVYAFEPNPANYAYLQRNLDANVCTNTWPQRLAVSNRTGQVMFTFHDQADQGWVSRSSPTGSPIAAVSLDDFFEREGWPQIDLVKMDIEGSESSALEGMRELVARNPGLQLIMEFDRYYLGRHGGSRETIAARLIDLGFKEGCVLEQTRQLHVMPDGLPRTQGTYNLFLIRQAT